MEVGIDSIVAIPIDQWSTNFVTPQLKCVRVNGRCSSTNYPNAPGPSETALVPFAPKDQPQWVVIDANTPMADVNGKVPNPGLYVLVATYKQNNPSKPEIQKQLKEKSWTQFIRTFSLFRSGAQHEYYA